MSPKFQRPHPNTDAAFSRSCASHSRRPSSERILVRRELCGGGEICGVRRLSVPFTGKSGRKIRSVSITDVTENDASLMQKSGPCAALGGSGHFLRASEQIKFGGLFKTHLRSPRIGRSEVCIDAAARHPLSDGRVDCAVALAGRACRERVCCGEDERIRKVRAVLHDSAARHPTHQLASFREPGDRGVADEIAKAHRRDLPVIKPQSRDGDAFQKDLVERHIHRCGARRAIVDDAEFCNKHAAVLQKARQFVIRNCRDPSNHVRIHPLC